MTDTHFASIRPRDDRGRFLKMPRPNGDMLFCRRRGTARPMAVVATGKGFKGFVNRLSAALLILKSGIIPVIIVKSQSPLGDWSTLIGENLLGDIADDEDERHGT
jgi:hypothetical protein